MAKYSAGDLFDLIESGTDFVLVDVRNEGDFARFSIEGPNDFTMLNIPYFDFIEQPEESTTKVPEGKPIRVVCAKEGSSQFVAEVLESFGRTDVAYLDGGINTWGNLLVPRRIDEENTSYEFWQFNRPAKASCAYGLIHAGEMMVFDPSRGVDFLIDFAASRGAKITHTFETHLQADYISGSPMLQEKTGALFVAHEGDYGFSEHDTHSIVDGDVYTFTSGGPSVLATHSPGHTPGSTTYVIDEKYMISGDTVFIVSVGRPDLGKQVVEWAKTLYSTLKERITVLPDELIVLPGHFTDWEREADERLLIANDFGSVKALNESIYGIDDESVFVEYIQANMREQPEIYAQIRLVNAGKLHPCPDESNVMDLGKNECAASSHNTIPNA